MEKLYALTTTDDSAKEALYIRKRDSALDFFTYFNSFSLEKWRQYTTLQSLTLRLQLTGSWKITWKVSDETGEHFLLEETNIHTDYEHIFPTNLPGNLLGFELTPLEKGSTYQGGAWYGTFSQWQEQKIGISICTFKREEYVKRTIAVLRDFQQENDWLSVLVVDNGSTLPEEEKDNFRILHNPNYGGSGGFTRGMIEYVEKGNVDYILLMDDDIVLDPTALERTHSLLCGLRDKYKDSFLAGAMLRLEEPTIQHENTAYWGKIRLHPLGRGMDLSQLKNCEANEYLPEPVNTYGAWWYCCMPSKRIQEIGYPLPVFVKGDDMEYGIRNHKKWLHMNGIAVWHQSFAAKQNPVVDYYNDRNMLIISHYADNCNRFTFMGTLLGRLARHILRKSIPSIKMYEKAIRDYASGFEGITAIGADKKMQEVQAYHNPKGTLAAFFTSLKLGLREFCCYGKRRKQYRDFRFHYLKDRHFWKEYLK